MSAYLASLSGLWLIDAAKVHELTAFAHARLAGWRPDTETREALRDSQVARRRRAGPSGETAVIPILGTLVHRGDSLQASSGACSCQGVTAAVNAVMGDETVSHVVFDIDSPGGHVEGIPELAAKLQQLSARKPTTAVVNALCASAAYWLASQCREISVTPSGEVGSIGVFVILYDETASLERRGIKVHAIAAGANKLEGAPFQELSADSRAHYQGMVNHVHDDFVSAVAKGRHVSPAQVLKRFGQGRVYDAQNALARGMVDHIETLDDALRRVQARPGHTAPAQRQGRVENARLRAQADIDQIRMALSLLE